MTRQRRHPGAYVTGLLTAVVLFVVAAALAKLLPRDTADGLRHLISFLVLGGILLILAVGVAAVSARWPDKVLALVTVLFLVVAAVTYPVSRAEQNLPVVFSVGAFFPVGAALGLAGLIVLVSRVVGKRVRTRPAASPQDR